MFTQQYQLLFKCPGSFSTAANVMQIIRFPKICLVVQAFIGYVSDIKYQQEQNMQTHTVCFIFCWFYPESFLNLFDYFNLNALGQNKTVEDVILGFGRH